MEMVEKRAEEKRTNKKQKGGRRAQCKKED
jgi:hypothetical protein